MRNVTSLLKPGGKLVLMGVLNNQLYAVGHDKFYSLSLQMDDEVQPIISEINLNINITVTLMYNLTEKNAIALWEILHCDVFVHPCDLCSENTLCNYMYA
jgi:hypothetical protein